MLLAVTTFSSPNSQNNYLFGLKEFVISWFVVLNILVGVIFTITVIIGIMKVRRVQKMREEDRVIINDLSWQIADLVKLFESHSKMYMDITYAFSEANTAYKSGNYKRAIDYLLRV